MIKALMTYILIILSLIACERTKTIKTKKKNITTSRNNEHNYFSKIKYAKGFDIKTNTKGYKELTVLNPWHKGEILQKLYLVQRNSNITTPTDGTRIEVPIRSIASLSNTQIGILKSLDEDNKIIAVSVTDNIYDKKLVLRISKGEIIGLGHAANLNFEKIIDLSPELTMLTAYINKSPVQKKLEQAGLSIVYNIEWMESTPLARAEWCKYIACFFNKEKEADKIFNTIEKKYIDAKNLLLTTTTKPSIIAGSQFKGIWYTPNKNSYMARLLEDAGGDYPWVSKETKGSIPLNFETVYDKQENADIWINPGEFTSLKQMLNSDKRYSLFKAFEKKQIFSKTKRINHKGANDYWESGVMKPDIILKDFIKIIHPEKLAEYELYYYKKLQ